MGGGDELRSVVGFIAKTLVVGEYPLMLRIVTLALVDQCPDELRLDKRVVSLPRGADALAEKHRDRCLKAGIVAAVGATVVAAVDEFAFRGQ